MNSRCMAPLGNIIGIVVSTPYGRIYVPAGPWRILRVKQVLHEKKLSIHKIIDFVSYL